MLLIFFLVRYTHAEVLQREKGYPFKGSIRQIHPFYFSSFASQLVKNKLYHFLLPAQFLSNKTQKWERERERSERWMQRFIDRFMFVLVSQQISQEEIDEPLPPVTSPYHTHQPKTKTKTKTKNKIYYCLYFSDNKIQKQIKIEKQKKTWNG